MSQVQEGSFLTLHYRMSDPQGQVIIDTFGGQPATLSLGQGELSPAIEQRLQTAGTDLVVGEDNRAHELVILFQNRLDHKARATAYLFVNATHVFAQQAHAKKQDADQGKDQREEGEHAFDFSAKDKAADQEQEEQRGRTNGQ